MQTQLASRRLFRVFTVYRHYERRRSTWTKQVNLKRGLSPLCSSFILHVSRTRFLFSPFFFHSFFSCSVSVSNSSTPLLYSSFSLHKRYSETIHCSKESILPTFTPCWVGLVFCSPPILGTKETWQRQKFSRPVFLQNCCRASRYIALSMSPTVPPTSIKQMSGETPWASTALWDTRLIHDWTASVTCGTT